MTARPRRHVRVWETLVYEGSCHADALDPEAVRWLVRRGHAHWSGPWVVPGPPPDPPEPDPPPLTERVLKALDRPRTARELAALLRVARQRVGHALQGLADRGAVRSVGRADGWGRPYLWARYRQA